MVPAQTANQADVLIELAGKTHAHPRHEVEARAIWRHGVGRAQHADAQVGEERPTLFGDKVPAKAQAGAEAKRRITALFVEAPEPGLEQPLDVVDDKLVVAEREALIEGFALIGRRKAHDVAAKALLAVPRGRGLARVIGLGLRPRAPGLVDEPRTGGLARRLLMGDGRLAKAGQGDQRKQDLQHGRAHGVKDTTGSGAVLATTWPAKTSENLSMTNNSTDRRLTSLEEAMLFGEQSTSELREVADEAVRRVMALEKRLDAIEVRLGSLVQTDPDLSEPNMPEHERPPHSAG